MTKPLTPADAAAYLRRWAEVETRQVELDRDELLEARFRQLCALFDARHLFPADQGREAEAEIVRERWRRLREAYGSG